LTILRSCATGELVIYGDAYSAGPVAERGIALVWQSQWLLRTVQATSDHADQRMGMR